MGRLRDRRRRQCRLKKEMLCGHAGLVRGMKSILSGRDILSCSHYAAAGPATTAEMNTLELVHWKLSKKSFLGDEMSPSHIVHLKCTSRWYMQQQGTRVLIFTFRSAVSRCLLLWGQEAQQSHLSQTFGSRNSDAGIKFHFFYLIVSNYIVVC